MLDPRRMQEIAAGRAQTYAVLSALYLAPPSGDLADIIRGGGFAAEAGSALEAAAADLTAFFRSAAPGNFLDSELAAEYTRLFVLPSGVVPHESFYLDENKRVGGRVTAGVQQYYQDAAVRLTGACLELPDHLGVELEFMKFLCDLEQQFWGTLDFAGLQKSINFQDGFLGQHLLRWSGRVCERVLAETNSDLYRALACLTLDFLRVEEAFVPELTGEIHSEWRQVCVSES